MKDKGINPEKLHDGEEISGKVVTIYSATCNSDHDEGRGSRVDNSYHTERRPALIACRGIGVMGGDGEVFERLVIRNNDGRYFLPKNDGAPIVITGVDEEVKAEAELREKALGKLSPTERAALGL